MRSVHLVYCGVLMTGLDCFYFVLSCLGMNAFMACLMCGLFVCLSFGE